MLHSITEETHIHKQVLVFLVLLLLLLLVFYKQVRVSRSSLSQSFQLHSSPVTRQKFHNPFYPLKVTFLPILPDHIPLLSHRAIATSCLQAASLPLQTTLSPAASSLKSHKYSPALYQTSTTQPSHQISLQFNTFNPFISAPPLSLFLLTSGTYCSPQYLQHHLSSGFPHKWELNLNLVLLVQLLEKQALIAYIRKLYGQAGKKFVFKKKIKTWQILGGEVLKFLQNDN